MSPLSFSTFCLQGHTIETDQYRLVAPLLNLDRFYELRSNRCGRGQSVILKKQWLLFSREGEKVKVIINDSLIQEILEENLLVPRLRTEPAEKALWSSTPDPLTHRFMN